MTGTALLALVAAGSALGAHLLTRARWTWRTPRTAIALWQALGLAWGLASIGTLLGFGVAPYDDGVVAGIGRSLRDPRPLSPIHLAALAAGLTLALMLLGVLMIAIAGVVRARRRHRALLALVAHGDPEVPGTLVVDHPVAAAYCVPGVRSQVVVSAGTLELLGPYELAAVLAHERAHARERHDLVLLPFTSLRRMLPQSRTVARTLDAVELLIEMAADDRARRHRPAKELATALLRFASAGSAPSPVGTLGIIGADETNPILVRVRRLLTPDPLPRRVRGAMLAGATLVATLPLILYALPA
ncbi:M56 family metallopeptidase [Actinoallomurus iriomotensis]|uniref:Integral membrane protein n=1 Tax=Actinoallomurus iriomotensis TaxID=478107 RepID=A0A9W6RX67_9ACTN|nr:M56 family metallopeptidase [Actinoallomurus iriomotensis]GLY83685.1 integral membrane protein [Actinoallomurus iriomotensis]